VTDRGRLLAPPLMPGGGEDRTIRSTLCPRKRLDPAGNRSIKVEPLRGSGGGSSRSGFGHLSHK
jgi:hypothetical protein